MRDATDTALCTPGQTSRNSESVSQGKSPSVSGLGIDATAITSMFGFIDASAPGVSSGRNLLEPFAVRRQPMIRRQDVSARSSSSTTQPNWRISMNFKSNSSRLVALATVAAIGLSMGTANAETTVPVQTKGGDACTVTSGAYKGQTGNFTNGGGYLMCSGKGFTVLCDHSCKSAALTVPVSTLPGRFPILQSSTFVFTR
jgi:hypothetical protein